MLNRDKMKTHNPLPPKTHAKLQPEILFKLYKIKDKGKISKLSPQKTITFKGATVTLRAD